MHVNFLPPDFYFVPAALLIQCVDCGWYWIPTNIYTHSPFMSTSTGDGQNEGDCAIVLSILFRPTIVFLELAPSKALARTTIPGVPPSATIRPAAVALSGVSLYIYICIYIYICMHTYIYIYMHIYIYMSLFGRFKHHSFGHF